MTSFLFFLRSKPRQPIGGSSQALGAYKKLLPPASAHPHVSPDRLASESSFPKLCGQWGSAPLLRGVERREEISSLTVGPQLRVLFFRGGGNRNEGWPASCGLRSWMRRCWLRTVSCADRGRVWNRSWNCVVAVVIKSALCSRAVTHEKRASSSLGVWRKAVVSSCHA